jgi:hypothetical protein
MLRQNLTSRLRSLAIASAIAVTCTIWFTTHATAQNQRASGFLAYGMIGITSGQTLRLNAASVNVRREVPVELLFLDTQGNVIGRSAERVLPGHAIFLELPFSPTGTGRRMQVRGLIRWATDLGPEEYVIPTLEVIDDVTGRTTVMDPDPTA